MKTKLFWFLSGIHLDRRALWILFGLSTLVGIGFGLFSWLFPSVVIEWSTGSELDTVGFNVFRSESLGSHYARINDQIVPSSGDSLAGGQYSFTDTHVKALHRYYYLLEDVNAEGTGTKYGPRLVDRVGWVELSLSGILWAVGVIGLGMLMRKSCNLREPCPGLP